MRVIVEGKKGILSLLPQARLREGTYIRSRYILRRETEDGTLLCSTLTGEMVLLSPEEREAFDRLPDSAAPVLAEAAAHRFAVPGDHTETQTVEQLRDLIQKRREGKKTISHYNILPTTFCNARCFYCFENGIRQVHMSDQTADRLVEFIAAHHGDKPVTLNWFGGEPMLGRRQIDRICRALDGRGIGYTSRMTSNGYLFDAGLAEHAREAWKMKHIQITLDGTHDIYNRTKAYVSPGEDPYDRVMKNIALLAEAGVRVSIRLNMDSHNAGDLAGLIDELAERFGGNSHIYVYVRQLNEGAGAEPIAHRKDELEQLKRQRISLEEKLESKGWLRYSEKQLPGLQANSCMADDPQGIQCAPDGTFSKCENQIFENTVGTLEAGVTDREQMRRWQERQIWQGCAECPLFPSCICLIKNCPVTQGKCDDHDREKRTARYLDLMLEKYEAWKRGECDDGGEELPDETGRTDC